MISDPTPINDRGFLAYAGGPIKTSYGHTINVYESSAASAPHVWVAVSESREVDGHNAHLTLEQAIMLRAALDQFIEGVAAAGDAAAEMVAEAKRVVLGES